MAIAIDQASIGSADIAATATTLDVVTSAAVAANGVIFFTVSWDHASATLSSVAGGSLSWSIIAQAANSNMHVALVRAQAPAGLASSTTITFTFSATSTNRAAVGSSFTGVGSGAAQDSGTATGTTGAHTSATMDVTGSDVLVISAAGMWTASFGNTPTAPTLEAVELGASNADKRLIVEYKIVAADGGYTTDGNWGHAGSAEFVVCSGGFAGDGVAPQLSFDLATEFERTATTDPQTWTHTTSASPSGVVVAIVHGTSSTDHVSTVTYGGVSLAEIVRAVDTTTEAGAAELWFLGSGIPTGNQTVSVDLASATTDDIHFICFTVKNVGNTEVIDFDLLQAENANPTVVMSKGGRLGWSVAAMYGGGAAPGGTLATGNTLGPIFDIAAFYSQSCYETTIDTSDHTIGWSTLGADDLAFVALCVAEVLSYIPRHPAHDHGSVTIF